MVLSEYLLHIDLFRWMLENKMINRKKTEYADEYNEDDNDNDNQWSFL